MAIFELGKWRGTREQPVFRGVYGKDCFFKKYLYICDIIRRDICKQVERSILLCLYDIVYLFKLNAKLVLIVGYYVIV